MQNGLMLSGNKTILMLRHLRWREEWIVCEECQNESVQRACKKAAGLKYEGLIDSFHIFDGGDDICDCVDEAWQVSETIFRLQVRED